MVRDLTLVQSHEVSDVMLDRFLEEAYDRVIHRRNWSWRAKELSAPVLAGDTFFDLKDFDPPPEPPPEPEVPPVEPLRPNIVTELIAAYDAFHLNLAHDEIVDVWPSEGDRTGMSLSVSSTGKPRYKKFATPTQMPGVHFDEFRNIQTSPGSTYGPCTIFLVASNPRNGIGFCYLNDESAYQPFAVKRSQPDTFHWGSSETSYLEVEDPHLAGDYVIWTFQLNNNPVPSAIRIDGVDQASGLLETITATEYAGVRLGAAASADLPGATMESPDWTVHELLIYNGAVPGVDMLAIEEYLVDKWILPWNLTVPVPFALPVFGDPHPAPGITSIGDLRITHNGRHDGAWTQVTRSELTFDPGLDEVQGTLRNDHCYWFDLPEYKIRYSHALENDGEIFFYVFYSPVWGPHPDDDEALPIPVHHHRTTLGNWAMYRVWERQEDFDRSDAYLGRFELGMQELIYEENTRNSDRPKIFGQLPSVRRRRSGNMPWLNGV